MYSLKTIAVRLAVSASLVGAAFAGGTATAVATAPPSSPPAVTSEIQLSDSPTRVFGSLNECRSFINPAIMFCAPYYSGTYGAWYIGETPPEIWAR